MKNKKDFNNLEKALPLANDYSRKITIRVNFFAKLRKMKTLLMSEMKEIEFNPC